MYRSVMNILTLNYEDARWYTLVCKNSMKKKEPP